MPTIPGGAEWLIILVIFVLLFGAKKLPELSRSVGQSITSFKQGVHEAGPEEGETGGHGATGSESPSDGGSAQAPRAEQAQAPRAEEAQAPRAENGELGSQPRDHGNA